MTSACAKHLGKADDCIELQALRRFRDEHIAKTANGLKLIKTYYAVAPQIVQKVDSSANAGDYYNGICATICKRLELIKQNKLHQTIDEHKKMVLSLQNEFNIA